MTEETRNQKLLRELNEEKDRDESALKGINAEGRRVMVILIMIVAVVALVAGLVWAGMARAETMDLEFKCKIGEDVCFMTRETSLKMQALVSHNNAVTAKLRNQFVVNEELKREVAALRARKCNALNES